MPTKSHLQISLNADLDHNPANGPEVHVTPIDLPVGPELAKALREAIALGDLGDSVPGDGKIEADGVLKIPVRLVFLNTNIQVPYTAVLQVVEK